ncbi:MAG: DegT/DnrJ/EryC1/StrS family aminotransferase, partial [Clostridia bacterium]|nr:DegT/DnrJ/EryC1/StrS family aminotransferase [Clostridia bacterium]
WYQHEELGFNYRMSNVIAGVVRGQIPYLKEHIEQKKAIYFRYQEGLKDLPVHFSDIDPRTEPNYWLTVLSIDKDSGKTPDDAIDMLAGENIESRRAWNPMHSQPFFAQYEYYTDSASVSQRIFDTGMCMPSGDSMTDDDVQRVIEVFRRTFE